MIVMDDLKDFNPIAFLDDYRGKSFAGEWPTVSEMFSISVSRFADNNCFSDFDGEGGTKRTFTYREAKDKIDALSCFMRACGVEKGDRIAVSGKNSPEWAITYLAALYCSAIICPIDYALHEAEQENLLRRAEPKLFFVDEEKFEYYKNKDTPYKVYSLSPKNKDDYVLSLRGEDCVKASSSPSENDTAAILFTSGTTGTPKGVMLSHKNLVSDCYIAQSHMHLYDSDVFYALLPIHHAYTMLAVFIEAISVGAEVVFGKSMAVTRLMKELREGKITMLLGVPLLFNKIASGIDKGMREKGALVYGVLKAMRHLSYLIKKITGKNLGKTLFKTVLKKANLYTIRIAICGGGPLASSVFRLYNEMGIDFVQGYGLTETSPIIALNPVQHFKIESVGKYFDKYMDMKIINANADGIGEIVVKGPMVMQGYYKMEAETAAVFTPDGYFKTGDLGRLDSEGYLMLSGRVKNMIVTDGGKNVYPEEIEDMFQLETSIAQITVQGYVMDEKTKSEGIEALIYKAEGSSEADVKEAVERVNKKLLPYQRISKVTHLEKPLEMTTTLKVKRNYAKS